MKRAPKKKDIFAKAGLKPPYVILAPMAGITSYPFRAVSRAFGCEFAFTEMICSRSLSNLNKKTLKMLELSPSDRPIGVQLLGRTPEYVMKSIDILEGYSFDVLDLNAACPIKKIINAGKGASLLKAPAELSALLKAMVKRSTRPVTVKIRVGWSDASGAHDIARACEDAGVSAIIVHGRTRQQGYAGKVDYSAVGKVKKAVETVVIGSGDVFGPELAGKMLEETGCDGVAVARGALGNPWIFSEIREYLSTGKRLPGPGADEIARVMAGHFAECLTFFGEKQGIKIFHKFYIWYTRGMPNVKTLRARVEKMKTREEMAELIREFCATRTPAVKCPELTAL